MQHNILINIYIVEDQAKLINMYFTSHTFFVGSTFPLACLSLDMMLVFAFELGAGVYGVSTPTMFVNVKLAKMVSKVN